MKITTRCPNCRLRSDVSAPCLLLEVWDTEESENSSVHWVCFSCSELVTLPVDLAMVIDLVSAGASVLDNTSRDFRPPHPETAVGGPEFTRDDLLEFHERLADDGWLTLVLGPGGRNESDRSGARDVSDSPERACGPWPPP